MHAYAKEYGGKAMMRAREWVPRLIATVLIAAYLLFMPAYLNDALKERTYDEKFSPTEEPYTGIISVWHIVGFKPYSGSMCTCLLYTSPSPRD